MSLTAGANLSGIESATDEQDGDIPRASPLRLIPMNIETVDNLPVGRSNCPRVAFLWICGTSIFLTPMVIVSGMTASHGDDWKRIFFGLFAAWLVLCSIGLFLDLRTLSGKAIAKRCLWHLSCCIAALWFFIWTLQISSENLPQWLPTAIDCGLGASLGLQSIPTSSRKRIGDYIGSILGSIFGGTQVNLHHSEEQLLPRSEPMSPSSWSAPESSNLET